jgi:alkyl hydroperoxide reductase subunit D
MPLPELLKTLPAYARDVARSAEVALGESLLAPQALWGTVLACAYATGVGPLIVATEQSTAAAGLPAEACEAARGAAALMAMNNVYFRALHLMQNQEYRTLPARLRASLTANPGVDGADFELWCFAVSAINGCGACMDSHEEELRRRGASAQQVQAGLRISAAVNGIGHVLRAEAGQN